jgi:hypothetical protein
VLRGFLSYAVDLVFLNSNGTKSKDHKYRRLRVVLRSRTQPDGIPSLPRPQLLVSQVSKSTPRQVLPAGVSSVES